MRKILIDLFLLFAPDYADETDKIKNWHLVAFFVVLGIGIYLVSLSF
ncbi:MAG: hypothetical protein JXB00_16695 [Bacteroidales bacterium]|nr:hypothetical protein [Bacteroidales bacterium]MBN2613194.1 hypothetical protein [Bacteroidales bacterium]